MTDISGDISIGNDLADDPSQRPTYARRLTAPGRGAIAVVRVWGLRAVELVDSVFKHDRGVLLAGSPRGVLRTGHIGRGPGDQVVVVVLDEDPPAVEVQCHGGDAAVSLVVEALQAAGAIDCDSPRLSPRNRDDPFADDALSLLVQTQTLATAEILLDQTQGALHTSIVRLRDGIEDQPERALTELDALIGRGQLGLRLVRGWRVAIAGRPNVGKSRLFNALVGFARAIVDPTPGTTRDVVSLTVSFAGWPVELADTAGLRATVDPVEQIGVERSRREHEQADLIILVLDRSRPLEPVDHQLLETAADAILVASKCDLPPAWQAGDVVRRERTLVSVSAATGDGLDALIAAIVRQLVPEPPPAGAGVPFRKDQLDALDQVKASLLAGDRGESLKRLSGMVERR